MAAPGTPNDLITSRGSTAVLGDRAVGGAAARSHWFIVGTVCIGALMAMLDASIVNVAMPTFQGYFQTTVAEVEWISIAYLLTLTMLLTIFGRVADLFGRSRMYNLGFVVFIIGSAACAVSPSLGVLIGARVMQASGAAMLQTNSVALITAATPRHRLGSAIGVQGAAQAIGLAIGPSVGGILLATFGWQAVFWVNVPFGIMGTILALILLPKDPHVEGKPTFDGLGALLIALCTFTGMLGLSEGVSWGWASLRILGAFALCIVSGFLFIRWELSRSQPLLDPRLFLNGAFSMGCITGMISFIVLYGGLFLTPFYLSRAGHFPSEEIGFVLTAVPLALGVVAPFAGRFSDQLGPRMLTIGGMLFAAIGMAGMGIGIGGLMVVAIVLWLALLGLGLGLFTSPNNASIMNAAPRDRLSVASGILNMSRSLGMSAGVAVAGTAYAAGLVSLHSTNALAQGQSLRVAFLIVAGFGLLAAFLSGTRGDERPSAEMRAHAKALDLESM